MFDVTRQIIHIRQWSFRARPQLEPLEVRQTPSTTAFLGGYISPDAIYDTPKFEDCLATQIPEMSGHGVVPLAPPVFPATSTVNINFGPLPAVAAGSYKVHLRLRVGSGPQAQILEETYTIGAGATPENVRDLVRDSLQSVWNVSNSGSTGLTISGLKNNPLNLRINQAGIATTGLPAAAKSPALSISSGVQPLQPAGGGKWKLSFLPRFEDGSTVLTHGGIVTATLNGTEISATLSAGMGPSQVAQSLFVSMIHAGVTDVVLSGSDLEFLNDPVGMETIVTSLQFRSTAPNHSPAEGLIFAISPAERYIYA